MSTESLNDTDCQMKVGPHYQCCCNCIYLKPVHHHCSTLPTPTGKPRQRGECFCKVQKGWACVAPEGGEGISRVYDNWPKHSVGCEEYIAKNYYPRTNPGSKHAPVAQLDGAAVS